MFSESIFPMTSPFQHVSNQLAAANIEIEMLGIEIASLKAQLEQSKVSTNVWREAFIATKR